MIPTQTPQTIYDILKSSLTYYIDVFKAIWPLLIGLALLKNVFFYAMYHLPNVYFTVCLALIFLLIVLFMFSMMLYQADQVIFGYSCTIQQAAKTTWNRYLRIVLSFILICCLFISTFLLARLLVLHFGRMHSDSVTIILFFIIGFVLLIEILYCFYIIPLIAVNNETGFSAFKHSTEFLRENLKFVCMPYFFLVVLMILIAPGSHHYQWLTHHFLSLPFDLIVISLLLPFILNIILFTMKSLQSDSIEKG